MKRIFALAVLLLSMPFALAAQEAAPKYVEGTHYVRLAQPVRTAMFKAPLRSVLAAVAG